MPFKEKIYWHPCKTLHIGNYVKEAKKGGEIDRPEEELIFKDHIFVAKTQKDITFIEKCRSFKNGQIQLCESMRQATSLTSAHNRRKYATQESFAKPDAPVDETVTKEVSATG